MGNRIRYKAYTDAGNRGGINQDAVFCYTGENFSLFCVADGMGGHSHGELASNELTARIASWCKAADERNDDLTALCDEIEEIANEVSDSIRMEGEAIGRICGTTFVALLIRDDRYTVLSVGDSRIYRLHRGSLIQLTRDDVWENQSGVAGTKTDTELRRSPNYGKLTAAVGVTEGVVLNRTSGEIRRRDVFLLCSDGVYKMIPDEQIKKMLRGSMFDLGSARKTENIVNAISAKVRDNGAPDNYSMITVVI